MLIKLRILIILFVFVTIQTISHSQYEPKNTFYLNISGISTWGLAYYGDIIHSPSSAKNWGVYCGNDFTVYSLSENLKFSIEFYYLNNNFIISEVGDNRFELHQNIGVNFKSGYRYGDLTTYLLVGINAFYLFDKNEVTGYQIDRFDNSMFYGIEQVYNLNERCYISLGYSKSNFERESFYTPVTLTSISVLKLGVGVRFS
tara:strand:- start:215 stop:817 length:603 start_codon:yes stop_codon:yes gene_type:complete